MSKSVVITGANSGIGLATALELAAHGYDVIGTVRSEEKAETLRLAAVDREVIVRSVICDVTDAEQTERAFLEVAAMTDGGPWAVVNNAGYAHPGAVEDVSDDDARAQLETNVIAPARIARLVLPSMRERGEGRIVMVSSIAGRTTLPLMGWYHASKHALEALTDSLRMEVSPFGVRVTLVEPGSFDTGIWSEGQSRLPGGADSAYRAAYEKATSVTGNADKMPSPVWVARTIRLALASPVPLSRYLVGVDAMTFAFLDSIAPDVVSDYVKQIGTGLRKLPFLG
jgi:NAD(P)-dependent dehydrogenase (short-subunit alcohol dehydrogenase family)